LVGSLASQFPQLDKERLWNSIGQALEGLPECEGGDVEKLGVVKLLVDKPNSFPMSPSTSTLHEPSELGLNNGMKGGLTDGVKDSVPDGMNDRECSSVLG